MMYSAGQSSVTEILAFEKERADEVIAAQLGISIDDELTALCKTLEERYQLRLARATRCLEAVSADSIQADLLNSMV